MLETQRNTVVCLQVALHWGCARCDVAWIFHAMCDRSDRCHILCRKGADESPFRSVLNTVHLTHFDTSYSTHLYPLHIESLNIPHSLSKLSLHSTLRTPNFTLYTLRSTVNHGTVTRGKVYQTVFIRGRGHTRASDMMWIRVRGFYGCHISLHAQSPWQEGFPMTHGKNMKLSPQGTDCIVRGCAL